MYDRNAYDLERFAPAEPNRQPRRKQQPQQPRIVRPEPKSKKLVLHEESLAAARSLKIILSASLVLGFIMFALFSSVKLTNLDYQIEDQKLKIEQVQGENKRLQMELDGLVSHNIAEQYATLNLGMSKVENYQKEFIKLKKPDSVVKAGGQEVGQNSAKAKTGAE